MIKHTLIDEFTGELQEQATELRRETENLVREDDTIARRQLMAIIDLDWDEYHRLEALKEKGYERDPGKLN